MKCEREKSIVHVVHVADLNIVSLAQTGIKQMPTLRSRWNEIVIGLIKYSIHEKRVVLNEREKKTHKQSTRKLNESCSMSDVYSFFL